ncbi:hypothetical protein C3L33_19042, partial [Rhododendron williamsianum]
MKLLHSISGHHRSLVRAIGRRYFAASTEEFAKRNYANNDSEYNTVITSLTSQRRHYLLRDVYDDMMLDGVKPERDTFHSLIMGTMKGARLQDAFFFRNEMKAMGLVPDVALYNFLISTCGKCKNSQQAIQILEEMKRYEVKPTGQTFICLLNACAAAGRLDRVYGTKIPWTDFSTYVLIVAISYMVHGLHGSHAIVFGLQYGIVRDMTAAGLGLNKFCYAGLIAAHKNKTPITDDTASKIIELVEQSKGWSSVESTRNNAENVLMGITEEELYNTPTAEYIHRKGGFISRELTVYHVAFLACADLRNVEAMEILLEMLTKDGKIPDVYCLIQIMRCYLHSGDLDRSQKVFEDYMNTGKQPMVELYVVSSTIQKMVGDASMTAMWNHNLELAMSLTEKMVARGFNLNPKMGNDLLLAASGEKERDIPADDQRLMLVSRTYANQRQRFGQGPGRS